MSDDAARAALRARQGAGARYDAPEAPADALLMARRGTAYFSRVLNLLTDDDLYAPSACPGWQRAHVVACVSYQARALTWSIDDALGRPEAEEVTTRAALMGRIDMGASLPARALRTLYDHTRIHLDVVWRDLSAQDWSVAIETEPGTYLAMAKTPSWRARDIWHGALALNAGGRLADLPSSLREGTHQDLPASLLPDAGQP